MSEYRFWGVDAHGERHLFGLAKGSISEVLTTLDAIPRDKWSHAHMEVEEIDAYGKQPRKVHVIEYDGFTGVEIGSYETLEGKRGVVLQQLGTKVVHVYGEKWIKP